MSEAVTISLEKYQRACAGGTNLAWAYGLEKFMKKFPACLSTLQ